jgi:type 1 glutamine amidotransferase
MNLKSMKLIAAVLLAVCSAMPSAAADKHVVLIAGTPSHAPMEHEHNAGVLLLKKWLGTVKGIHVTVHLNGWPADASDLETADAILLYCDGAESHMAFKGNHAEILDKAAQRGAGMVFLHYAVEPPRGVAQSHMLNWIGGAFELNYSVNPVWEADFQTLPKHPVTNGVKPFRLRDEWYYNMRFPEGMAGVTPILTAVPPVSTLSQPDGPRSGNPEVRAKAGQPQQMAWAFERPGGGRGFGFTGVHYHKNWGDENFRKIVLNAVVWAAKAKVPPHGVAVTVRPEELAENLDPKPARK